MIVPQVKEVTMFFIPYPLFSLNPLMPLEYMKPTNSTRNGT